MRVSADNEISKFLEVRRISDDKIVTNVKSFDSETKEAEVYLILKFSGFLDVSFVIEDGLCLFVKTFLNDFYLYDKRTGKEFRGVEDGTK